ncbi:ABC transporter permease [Wenzhouxiangella limi]|uniref:ABC transporter permease n=1 Tax=Wenzhouxiangella limi TaxID=2707351 RepID=UPI001944385F|nr:iron ABC transporter permease [Wenzhouxiangella limi]
MSITPQHAAEPHATPRRFRPDGWTLLTVAVAGLVALPVITVLLHVLVPSGEVWSHLYETVLARYVANTLGLMLGVGAGTLLIGVGTAWLVVMCRFPGKRVFEWALLLPLAVPTYVIAYAYTDFLQFAGPVQTWLRELFDWGRADYWFPNVRSLGGAITLMSLVLYPYVYLLTRAAFMEQSVCALEVGRTLGRGPWRLFSSVAIPLARPAIVGGVALALMEALNDFGAVQFFGVDTFTTGIYRTWFGMGEAAAAAQLAACLLVFVLVLVMLERFSRRRARFHHTTGRYRELPQYRLGKGAATLAFLACALPILIGFAVPAALLLEMHFRVGDPLMGSRFWGFAWNSLILATVTAIVAVSLAVMIGYGVRLKPRALTRTAARMASVGYAIPGSVIAVGILIPLGWLDQQINLFAREYFGVLPGLLLTGTMVALVYAYVVRFLAVSFNTVEASLTKVTPNMDAASRTLGKTAAKTLALVHLPVMRSSLLAAAILVFVDVMKELPATIILRPFNFDTLAVRAFELASDERLAQASTAALGIVVVGIVPVILLSIAMRKSRPGGGMPNS